jgi:hypothetical protein
MNPPINSHVKILLRNNTTAEGIVKEWDTIVKLQSLDGQSYMIILHPQEDIILIKVFLEENYRKNIQEESQKTELEQQFQQVVEQPSDDPTRIKSLVELRGLLAKQDKQIIANKLKQHYIGTARKVEYGVPRFFKKPGSE